MKRKRPQETEDKYYKGIPGAISSRIFGPPPEDYILPDDAADLRAAYEWLKSPLTSEEWEARRVEVAKTLYQASGHPQQGADELGRFYEKRDTFAWYLFNVEAALEHPWNYEPYFGARVLPVVSAIGRQLSYLAKVPGVDERLTRLARFEKSQPNGGFFELLVAAAYARSGAEVAFRKEQPGIAATYDMDVRWGARSWAVECKRMETSDYGESERAVARRLWNIPAQGFHKIGRSVIVRANFKVEMKDVPEDYLYRLSLRFHRGSDRIFHWDDVIGSGTMRDLNLRPLQEALRTQDILTSSARMNELLTGHHSRTSNIIFALRHRTDLSPRYTSECDFGVVLDWRCTSEKAIDAKARDIVRHLSKACGQLPEKKPGVVHIGFECVDEDSIEERRFRKILDSVKGFDPGSKSLQYVYCHYFAPDSRPDGSFVFEETVQYIAVRPTAPRPLVDDALIAPNRAEWRSGVHWL